MIINSLEPQRYYSVNLNDPELIALSAEPEMKIDTESSSNPCTSCFDSTGVNISKKCCEKEASTSDNCFNCFVEEEKNICIDKPKSPKYRGSSRDAVGCLKEMDDFDLLECLGQGFFGMVYKVRERNTESNNVIVMKIPILQNKSSRLNDKKIVIKEDFMLRLLCHSNILKSRGLCVQRNREQWQLNLLVDFCNVGSLQQLILNRKRPFPWLQRCLTALDICKAMSYVHTKGFMHRDLTSMNILLQSQPNSSFPKAVVADFGLSSKIPEFPKSLQQVGTQNWMAPEVLKEQFYNEKADVFSFGVIMCQMIARIDADHDAGLYRTPMFGLDYVRFTTQCPSETPLNLLEIAFMSCLWDPESRPSFESLIQNIHELLNYPKFVNVYCFP